ncbi:hypothetical protein M0R45_004619 [Rubus argutus]|uniref:Esterase KAI2 n=1 Tax=Rubus argutus TaxID=59490 RepID=A0AAW1YKE8_RUBAR
MGMVEQAHNVRVLGSGQQLIVLAHGFGTDQFFWKHLVPHLVDDYRVILILNDTNYYRGFEEEDVEQLFEAIRSNYKVWCSGFASFTVGGNMDSVAVQKFRRTLFNMRLDIALSGAHTIFQSNMRQIIGHVTVPCHILQSVTDLAVSVIVTEFLHQNLGGELIVEVMPLDGHLPQLSSSDIVISVMLRCIRHDIAE